MPDNAEIIRELYRAFNAKDLARIAELCRPGLQVTLMPTGTAMPFRSFFRMWTVAFPESEVEVLSLVSQGDKVTVEGVGHGAHTGPLAGPVGKVAPTQRPIELAFVQCFELSAGKVAAERMYFDVADLMAQLGLEPLQRVQPAPVHVRMGR